MAPLVDHLSEAALNRERVRVEVEWLIHLTDARASCRASAALTDDEQAPAARRSSRTSAPTRSPSSPQIERETVHDVKAVEYFLKRRLAGIVGAGERPHRAGPLRLHQRGHQQPVLRPDGRAARSPRSGCPAATALVDAGRRRWPATCATCRCSRTPTASPPRRRRWARSWPSSPHRLRRQLRRIARRGVPRQAQRRDRHVRRARRRGARRRLAAVVSRAFVERLGLHLEPAHHADRVARLAGRALRRRRPVQPGPAQPVHRRLDLHLAAATSPRSAARARSAPRRCRTRSTRSGSRTPRPTSRSRSALLDVLALDAGDSRGCSATSPTPSMQRNIGTGVRPLAAGHRQRRAAGWPGSTPTRTRMAARPRRQLGGARRAGPVGDARASRRQGVDRHGEPVRAAQGADPRPPDHRRRPARVRRRARPARRRREAARSS